MHFHVCENCEKYWGHEALEHRPTKAETRSHHLCPECGSGPYRWAYKSVREAVKVVAFTRSTEITPTSAEDFLMVKA